MKELLKDILKKLGIYHPLQSFYRDSLFYFKQKRTRKEYKQFYGRGFLCNVCGEQYERFVPDHPSRENAHALRQHHVIAAYGDDILCPNCLSTARERLVIAELTAMPVSNLKILHLSPEKNVYQLLKQKGTVTTADLLPGFYKTVDGLVEKQDATHLSYSDSQFDLLVANHILEHIPNDRAAMREMLRVLKPGASAVLQVPYSETILSTIEEPAINNAARQSAQFGQKDHVRIYQLTGYVRRLHEAGFSVKVVPYAALEKYYQYAIQEGECFLKITKPLL